LTEGAKAVAKIKEASEEKLPARMGDWEAVFGFLNIKTGVVAPSVAHLKSFLSSK